MEGDLIGKRRNCNNEMGGKERGSSSRGAGGWAAAALWQGAVAEWGKVKGKKKRKKRKENKGKGKNKEKEKKIVKNSIIKLLIY